MAYIMRVEELKEKLAKEPNHVAIVDARFQLNDPDAGRKLYEEAHIPGAVYFDLEKDLSGKLEQHGGNHPLPSIPILEEKLGRAGIDNNTTVVVYDQGNDMFAPRFWWLLHFMGHDDTYVLDGGIEAWVNAGGTVTRDIPTPQPRTFQATLRPNEVVDMQYVKENVEHQKAILIDSRSKERYLGKIEPLYKKAGHIPGAKNYFWKDVLTPSGHWKSKEELEKHFSKFNKNKEIIVSCGSGVSATPNVLALKMAGFTNVKLYPGSYSDWISYEDNEIETKDETDE